MPERVRGGIFAEHRIFWKSLNNLSNGLQVCENRKGTWSLFIFITVVHMGHNNGNSNYQ